MPTLLTRRAPLRATLALAAALGGGLLSGCSGENGFAIPPGGGPPGTPTPDTEAPSATVQFPADSATVAVADSVFVQVRVQDDKVLGQVVLEGYAMRGDPNLGTPQRTERFVSKVVDLSPAAVGRVVTDTVITRYLVATSDSATESRVFVRATAVDTAGNLARDSVVVAIGGPRVEISTANNPVGAGRQVSLRIQAEDQLNAVRSILVRATGATTAETTLELVPPRQSVDTTYVLPLSNNPGTLQVQAIVTTVANQQAVSRPLNITVNPPVQDTKAPQVSFTADFPSRVEGGDTLRIAVQATDEERVDSVGATLLVRHRDLATGGTRTQTFALSRPAAADTLRFPVSRLGLSPADTVMLHVEVTAWATDPTGNCGAAVTVGSVQSLACAPSGGFRFATGLPGRLVNVLLARGATLPFPGNDPVIADLASDGSRVYASNYSAGVVEVLPVAASSFSQPITVGSKPWGLAIGVTGDTLLVANSGGTNISVVGLPASGTLRESRRIRTPDMRLYSVEYDVTTDTVGKVIEYDYSDRPQFLGQVASGQILYSTVPTATRSDGTIRIYDAAKDTTYEFGRGPEIFEQYASPRTGRAIAVNALAAGRSTLGNVTVCPRRLARSGPDPSCVTAYASVVSDSLAVLRAAGLTDTRLDLGLDIETVGLTDTTFVATSTDRGAIAFGEGAVDPGRVFYFRSQGGQLVGSTRETRDLVGNAAEKVIGLALNGDGSLGVARGDNVYFFDNSLRLIGEVASGSPTGGSAMHPLNTNYPADDGNRVGFSSGVTDAGVPYIDILDSYSFRSLRRLILRDPVIGAVVAVPVRLGDPDAGTYQVRLFAVTERGLLRIGLTAADLEN